ncbi:MAG: enolase C-terminal domain-like protein [Planctomycetota bacterium]
MAKPTDITIQEVLVEFKDNPYRCPIKFGGKVGTHSTDLHTVVAVETRAGQTADGYGSMPLGTTWSFPSDEVDADVKLVLMKELARRIAAMLPDVLAGEPVHPIELAHVFEPELLDAAKALGKENHLPVAVPAMFALVAASGFDAAAHDAFGKANGINAYRGYGPEFMTHELAKYLDDDFIGEYPDIYTREEPQERMPLYHLVGALDPLTGSDVAEPIGDGLPETLAEWIEADGLTHLKIKLNGDDLDWDVERVLGVHRVADEADAGRAWRYSLDFNERCETVEYLLDFIARLREGSEAAFERVQYIEQPTARDLAADRQNDMAAAARLKPVVIDESLVDYESLLLAEEMGYSGVALKACKGQSQSIVLGAAAQKRGLFLCVQDLTCTDAAYLHSVGLAAHVPTVAAVEGNGRQYCPAANRGWDELVPGAFDVRDGTIRTAGLTGPGLGCVPPGRERDILQNGL